MNADDRFAAVAQELYALPPGGFTAERNARAKAARAGGDRDLAARIAALPRSSASAWLVNVLVRTNGADLDRVLALGTALREAQQRGDRDRLRELGAERRELLSAVTGRAAERAGEAGHRVGDGPLEEFQQTLQAALVDDDAADAIRTGRLLRALKADGLDPVDLTDAVGGPGCRTVAPRPRHAGGSDRAVEAERDRQREEAAQRSAAAERRAADAQEEAEAAAQHARAAEAQADGRARAADELRIRLDQLRDALQQAEDQQRDAVDAASQARAAADRAARAAEDARREADAYPGTTPGHFGNRPPLLRGPSAADGAGRATP